MGIFASKAIGSDDSFKIVDNSLTQDKITTGTKKRRRNQSAPCYFETCWHSLPQEIQGQVLSYLDDEERCTVIPLVSREMRQIHRDYPPRRKEWSVYQPITRPMLDWFMGVAPRLEILTVVVEEKNVPGLLPELLAQAAKRAPQLRELHVAGDWESGAVHKSLSSLSQITELCLESWEFPACGNVKEMQRLSGLKSLEVLDLQWLHVNDATSRQMTAFWSALAKLKRLNSVTIHICGDCGVDDLPFFFNCVSLLTQLRALSLCNIYACVDEDLKLPASLGKLTQLTALEILDSRGGFPASALPPTVVALPCLERFRLHIADDGSGPYSFPLASRRLTSLVVRGGETNSVEELLPLTTPALSSLSTLELGNMALGKFPASFASAVKQLTSLDLSENSFSEIPAAVSQITGLRTLDLSGNHSLQLRPCDLNTLAALPHLQSLGLSRQSEGSKESGLSQSSVGVLIAVGQRWPNLRLHGFL